MPGAMAPDYVRGHGIRAGPDAPGRLHVRGRPDMGSHMGTTIPVAGRPVSSACSPPRYARAVLPMAEHLTLFGVPPCPLPRLMPAIEDFPHPVPASRRAAPVSAAGRRPRGVAERRRAIFGGHWAAKARQRDWPHVRWHLYCHKYYGENRKSPGAERHGTNPYRGKP